MFDHLKPKDRDDPVFAGISRFPLHALNAIAGVIRGTGIFHPPGLNGKPWIGKISGLKERSASSKSEVQLVSAGMVPLTTEIFISVDWPEENYVRCN
jgi:hypothetical protein